MSVEENKSILRNQHVEELFNKGNLSIADEIVSPDYVYHGPIGEFKGPEGLKQIVQMWRNAFPDGRFKVDDMVAEGDKVAVRYTWTGTHQGELMGIAATGKQVTMTAAYFYCFENGKEVEAMPYSDMSALYQQLGVTPPTE
ncbi:ester cyclase [Chloroflexota bacterium]